MIYPKFRLELEPGSAPASSSLPKIAPVLYTDAGDGIAVERYNSSVSYAILHLASREIAHSETLGRGEQCRDLGERWLGWNYCVPFRLHLSTVSHEGGQSIQSYVLRGAVSPTAVVGR